MCADPDTMQFFMDVIAHRQSLIEHIGVSYMLRGERGADFYDRVATIDAVAQLFQYSPQKREVSEREGLVVASGRHVASGAVESGENLG
jgi:hypothetical protein